MSRTRYATIVAVLAILAGSGVGAALGEVHRNASTPPAPKQPVIRTYETSRIQTFHATRLIAKAPFTLEELQVTGHGGTAVIEWYTGAWSPLVEKSTNAVALYLDGKEVAETVAGGLGGEYDARAGILRWVGPLSSGGHLVTVALAQSSGPVALPLVVAAAPVQEGVAITEHANAG